LARLTDVIKGIISPRLVQELPGHIRDELELWEIDPSNYRQEIEDLLQHYRREGMSESDLRKAKKIFTDKGLGDRTRGA
jgi:hypothetical protein